MPHQTCPAHRPDNATYSRYIIGNNYSHREGLSLRTEPGFIEHPTPEQSLQ